MCNKKFVCNEMQFFLHKKKFFLLFARKHLYIKNRDKMGDF